MAEKKKEIKGSYDLAKIFKNKSNFDLRDLAYKSKGWYLSEIARLKKDARIRTPRMIQRGDSKNIVNRMVIGKLYFYRYYPKGWQTLKWWDEYPLVIPFNTTANGFYGINLHYLPYHQRAWLLDRLIRASAGNSEDQRLRVSWEILTAISKVDVAKYAVHQYLNNRLLLPIREMQRVDYPKIIMLPIQRFHGPKSRYISRISK